MAKRELSLQQSEVNEIIHQLSQRAIFGNTPQRSSNNSQTVHHSSHKHYHQEKHDESSLQHLHHHHHHHNRGTAASSSLLISPITASSSHRQREELEIGFGKSFQQANKPAISPFPLSTRPKPTEEPLTDNYQNNRNSSNNKKRVGRERIGGETISERKHGGKIALDDLLGSSLLRESVNSLLSSQTSLSLPSPKDRPPLNSSNVTNHSQNHPQNHPQNPQEHLFRLYPEMLSPEMTRELISKALKENSK